MVAWRAAAVLEGRWDHASALACFRAGTEQIAREAVYELLVQNLRDALQSVHASALQVCYCTRGEGAVLGVPLASRKGRLLSRPRPHSRSSSSDSSFLR